MAEEEGDLESESFKEQLGGLLNCRSGDECGLQSKDYCARFCALVEDQTGRWQVPLPQLQVLRTALCYFTRDTATFPSDCEHLRYALSSLALSFFELLLFFGKDEFLESPLKGILESFQECQASLLRHKNLYLLLLKQVIKDGGPWENPVLQAILREEAAAQEEVERYLSSEAVAFFELRVRYLLGCERIQEAVALAKICIEHKEVGRCLYFHQAYLTCLLKASLYDHVQKEIAEIDGRDAVEIICNSEKEEKDDLLLALSRAFLVQQLENGDMYYIWDLIFIWSKIHIRANPSKQDFLEECHQLMQSATNVKSIFPFIKVVRAELGNEGLQFCVELCGRALQSDPHPDPFTKLLIYKTLAFLLPNDLEVCRACALLVFFLERTVESYKTVYLLYTHPDQEYHPDCEFIKNHIRFEVLQILKKGLFFDPEFWNLITLRTNCLKLMSEKVMQAALSEIMEEDKWIPNYCAKEPSKITLPPPVYRTNQVRGRPEKKLTRPVIRRIVVPPEVVEVSLVKKRGRKPGSRVIKVTDDSQLRRSFRQLDMAQDNSNRQHDNRQQRLLSRQGDKTLKRRGRKPRWLLQEMAKQAENRLAQLGRIKQLPTDAEVETKLHDNCLVQMDNDTMKAQEVSMEETSCDVQLTLQSPAEETPNVETVLLQEEGLPPLAMPLLDDPVLTPVPVTMLEVSIPENEVMDMSTEEVEVQPLADIALQEPCLEDGVDMEVVPAGEPFTESRDREGNSADEPPCNPSWFALPPEAKGQDFPECAVEVDNTVIQQLHNYSRNPEEEIVEENVLLLDAEPEEFPTASQECPSETTGAVQELSQACEVLRVELASPSQTPSGVASSSAADVEVPKRMPVAFEEVPAAVCQQEVINAEASRVATEASVYDDVIGVLEDETSAPSSAPQHLDSTLHADVIAGTENFKYSTDTIVNSVVNNTWGSDNMTAAPSSETVPSDGTSPSHGTVASDAAGTVPSDAAVPSNAAGAVPSDAAVSSYASETIPSDGTIPSHETAFRVETVPNDATVPGHVINGVIDLTASQTDTTHDPGLDSSIPSELPQTEILQPEKGSSEPVSQPVPDALSKKALKYRCKLCKKEYKGGNIMRHAVAHLQRDKLKCVFCGKLFNRPLIAKKHLQEHIVKLRLEWDSVSSSAPENGTPATQERVRRSQSRSAKHEITSEASAQKMVPSKKRKYNKRQEVLQNLEKVRDSNSVMDKKPVQKPNGSIVEGELKHEEEEYSCPSDGCTKKFVRRGMSMIRHALASHPSDAKVQEFAFHWRKGKCKFCQRAFWSFLHYQDHIKMHDDPLMYVCVHLDCKDRFKTKSELRVHLKSHQPLKAQCLFVGCSQTFSRMSHLQHHEWQHYPAPDTKEDSLRTMQMHSKAGRPARGKRKGSLDDSGHRVKVKKSSPKPEATVLNSGSSPGKAGIGTEVEDEYKAAGGTGTVERPVGTEDMSPECSGFDTQLLNGHRETVSPIQAYTRYTKESSKETPVVEINNVDIGIKPESIASHQEPVVQVQKPVKEAEAESSGYGGTSGRPFVRPPPSAYLDESFISMPKRRKSSPLDSRSSVDLSGSASSALRQRCSKCFSTFSSAEELQRHLSLNKCTSLFGFDSDEESAC